MTFYYGILVQVGKQIQLKDYYDFEPAVSEEDFFIVKELTKGRATPLTTRKNKAFYPLKGLLVCDFCGSQPPGRSALMAFLVCGAFES